MSAASAPTRASPAQLPLAQQQALLQALAAPHITNAIDLIAAYVLPTGTTGLNCSQNALERGLQAYRANASALAERALLAAYPVQKQLLGEEAFARLARDLWAAQPPERGDLAQWGGMLSAYLQSAPALTELVTEHPYLPDVARLEWALHTLANAADANQDTASFALLATQPPEALQLRLAPGTQLVPSAYPIVAIWQAHAQPTPDLGEAMRLLAEGVGQTALVWRQGYAQRARAAGAGEAALLRSVLAKENVGAAVAAAFALESALDLSGWLASAVQSGLVLGVASVCV
jgi:Putative DNA-binding domain